MYAQGEKLRNVNERLDDVNNTLTVTQKNLNSIKSVFGGIKNKFFSWSPASTATPTPAKPAESNKVSASSSINNMKPSNSKAEFGKITGSDREVELNKNLEEMSNGLSRLSELAKGLSNELDRQNPLIEDISRKTDKTHIRIDDQHSQMKRILK